MDAVDDLVHRLRSQITAVEGQLGDLKSQLAAAEQAAAQISHPTQQNGETHGSIMDEASLDADSEDQIRSLPLTYDEYRRYGRQMIIPEVGLSGQLALKNASILIVGVGGLGCPAAAYLAGAGVGKIGLVDGDTVELSNLHRQILHVEKSIGQRKVDSAAERLRALNSNIEIITYNHHLTLSTAVETMEVYDIILDCTDRPSTRYLISDTAVLAKKPVVTASALRTEGQLMVLNDSRYQEPKYRFCYRCVFPKPPPAESVLTCGEGGILGPVVGVMGVVMAMETMKIILHNKTYSPSAAAYQVGCENGGLEHDTYGSLTDPPSLLLYSAYGSPPFRSVRLSGKRKNCISCSDSSTITRETLASGSLDYVEFCGVLHPTNILSGDERISPAAYSKMRDAAKSPHVLIDVREKVQFDIGHLKDSVNIPFSEFSRDPAASLSLLEDVVNFHPSVVDGASLYFICRFGNDSQLAVNKFKDLEKFRDNVKYYYVGDIKGGLRAWRQQVDPEFPEY